MKITLLLIFFSLIICPHNHLIGKCGMAPKYRPLDCYKNSVLPEDLDELSEILSQFKNGGDDKDFADLLADMFDKKNYRENNNINDKKRKKIGGCGMHPKYLPVECYEQNILRRDKKQIREAYKKYHETEIKRFNEIYQQLIEKKFKYYNSNNKN